MGQHTKNMFIFPKAPFSESPYIQSACYFLKAICEACLGRIHAERMRFSGKQNMREVPVMACDFLTVSDILEICVVHKCCEITCDFLTVPDFLGKQFLNPT